MNWFQKNFKAIIYVAFLVPILAVAFVSISHVTTWYGLSNPLSWAIYLSIGIEIAALSALAAISAQMGKKVYFPFGIVTLIQFIGNIFFAYQYIDVSTAAFKDWVDLVDPIVSYLGVESGDPIGHKRFLALFSGGMLPIISLSFLHMLVKFEEEEKKNPTVQPTEIDIDKLSIEAGKIEAEFEKDKYTPTEEELKKLEEELVKLNEQKFGTLEGPTGSNGPDDSGLQEVQINEPEKKVLNYLRRDA
jgi:spermidine/putrescine-binding protein